MTTPIHRDEARKIVYGVGTVAGAVVVGLVGAVVQTGGALPGKPYTYVSADFTDVGVLKAGKDVKEGGVRVGQVSAIAYVDGHARVTLRLDGSHPVYKDATATVANVSALGKKYVAFYPGTQKAGELGDGVLPESQTSNYGALEDVFSTFDAPTRQHLQASLGELGPGLAGHGDDVQTLLAAAPALLDNVKQVTDAASGPGSDLPGLVRSANTLVSRFQGREQQLAALMRNADRTMAGLGVDHGAPLNATISALPGALDQAKSALDVLEKPVTDARVAVRELRPGTTALGRSTPQLRAFLRDAVTPLDQVPAVDSLAAPVLQDLTGTIADARPLVSQLVPAIESLRTLLDAFAPYAGDAGRFFSQHDLLSGTLQGTDDKHYFAALLTAPGAFSLAGVPDPLYRREVYPIPGTAWNHSTVTDIRSSGGNK